MTEMTLVSRALRTQAVNREVAAERKRQDKRWGVQSYDVGNKPSGVTQARANYLKSVCAEAAANGNLTWNDIVSEEIAEFFDEPDTDWPRQREEAIQIAAVLVAMIEDKDQAYADEIESSRERRRTEAAEADTCRD